jgi:hypothetical protein
MSLINDIIINDEHDNIESIADPSIRLYPWI